MRVIHTADWHLGTLCCGATLTGARAHAIDPHVHTRLAKDRRARNQDTAP